MFIHFHDIVFHLHVFLGASMPGFAFLVIFGTILGLKVYFSWLLVAANPSLASFCLFPFSQKMQGFCNFVSAKTLRRTVSDLFVNVFMRLALLKGFSIFGGE